VSVTRMVADNVVILGICPILDDSNDNTGKDNRPMKLKHTSNQQMRK
jgi:hypothetical protein